MVSGPKRREDPSHAIGMEWAGVYARARPLNDCDEPYGARLSLGKLAPLAFLRGLGPCVTVMKIDG